MKEQVVEKQLYTNWKAAIAHPEEIQQLATMQLLFTVQNQEQEIAVRVAMLQ
jgi:hypothetical protein